jgi:hypothetical protein
MKQLIAVLSLVCSVFVIGCAAQSEQPRLKQFYVCKGEDPGGEPYEISMETRVFNGETQFRQVSPKGDVIATGTGFYSDDRFVGVEWFGSDPTKPAVIEYVIKGKGLIGKWRPVGDAMVYPETCVETDTPPPAAPETPNAATGTEKV